MNVAMVRPRRSDAGVSEDPLWYKDAIIYQLHVKSFFDANNDGVGDFPGLISKLDYIAELGVNTIWLLPFYPSPRLDDGYDIADYRGVHPDYGTLNDVRHFIAAAHKRGLRVITELVINHTSDQHPWFQRARHAKPGSVYRDFYVWSDTDQKYAGTRIIFVDTERSNWTWDPVAGAYYWHRFYSHQPDLNFDNPRVLKELLAVMRYWAELGVDGLRLDAVPYLMEREGTNNENLPETHEVLKRIRAELDSHFPDRMLLAEANQWPEDTKDYFGDGDECHMAFNFPLMPRMYMAIAREDRFPITDILRQTPDIPANCQWAIFLRNHDELTLEMVTQSERDFLWETYAADRRARLNLGIRRRLAPLLERDRRRIELMHNLLLSLPGTPVIYYGDEIAMGDNIHLGDRDGVRTPMQWSPDRNGGFSRVPDPSRMVLPTIQDPLYGYEAVNVEAQASDRHSLLMWMRRTIAIRRQHQAFGRGTFRLLYPKNRKILAYLREHEDSVLLCVANLARTPQAVELDLAEFAGRLPVELDGGSIFPPLGQLPYMLTLPPYGFYWFLLAEETAWPSSHTPAPEPMPDYQTIVLRHDLATALATAHATIERESLPQYLAKRRWFAQKDQKLTSNHLTVTATLPGSDLVLAEIETATDAGTHRWFLPLGIAWEDRTQPALATQLALARVRRGPRVGLLTDAFALGEFAQSVISLLASGSVLATDAGTIRFEPTDRIKAIDIAQNADINWLSAEQSNSSLIIGSAAMLKIFRRVTDGPHPEAEMGRYLTEQGYANTAPLLGEMARVDRDGTRHALAIAQGFIRNQGDAWTWTLDLLIRGLSDLAIEVPAAEADPHEDYKAFAALLGQRVGELHMVLARPTDNVAFAPLVLDAACAEQWGIAAEAQLDAALAAIETPPPEAVIEDEDRAILGARRSEMGAAIRRLAADGVGGLRTRIHGDLHLGQVLVANGDVFVIDFEGEPAKPAEQRRGKNSRWRDVAGMLRSFDYAAAVVQRKSMASHAHLPAEQVDAFLSAFVRHASEAFMNGYRRATEAYPVAGDESLLTLFLIEKAAYEVTYEAANRPTWIDVPVRGLTRLAAQAAAEGSAGSPAGGGAEGPAESVVESKVT
ncbi:MAG: maltose alpha-D-glucosyltransferase [Acetobacteraceae bacterium]|nr:maltose alpha-D-glucosyltransferase [Acetobacteraceae bacterium]